MELANAMRGDDLFSDFLEEPEGCHRLLGAIAAIYPTYLKLLRSWADEIENGRILSSFLNVWMGPNPMGHFSNDAAMLCSAAVYEEFGFPYEAAVLSHFDNAIYHVHSEKMHYVKKLSELPGLRLIQVQPDPQVGGNMKNLDRILNSTGDRALMLAGTPADISPQLDRLAARNIYLRAYCASRDEAEEFTGHVRKKSRSLSG